ncbi:transglutaminase-like domain-containing protein [Anaerocolumna sp. AGMB13020]|uniref:transglutaminase-like domain-containing protein n=1 Tax=Anaerocolumna sp. AGMB13020 TaxID=3081750 RepID=UPI00295392B3|nr:transglutaminase-like domain-containing protein [Anaerocolumna sp. AGMB13020]WOO35228.1 transglutaminase-like domain-containing protein [Anaerocolumna sp. AGMB13020]
MGRRKEKSHDGIYIRGKETVLADVGKRNSLWYSLMQLLLIEAILYSVVFSLATGLGLSMNVLWLFSAVLLSGAVSFGLLFIPKISLVLMLPFAATYLYAGYRMWLELQNGFWHIENRFIMLMNNYYGTDAYRFLVDDFEPEKVVTIFLIFFTIPLGLLITLIIMDKINPVSYYILTMPFIVIPFVVGMIPDTFPFAIYIAATFSMFVFGSHMKKPSVKGTKDEKKHLLRRSKQFAKNNYYINLKSSFLMFTGVLLLFFLTSRFLTLETYEQKMNVPGVKNKIRVKVERFQVNDLADYFSFLNNGKVVIFQYSNSRGGLNEGKLGRVGKIKYDNKTDIIINALENDTSVYLKGFTGSVYDGDSWNDLSDEAVTDFEHYKSLWEKAGFSAGNQTGQLLDLLANIGRSYILEAGLHSYTMNIQNLDANRKYLYTPYYTYVNDISGIDTSNPEYIKVTRFDKDYTVNYVPSEKDGSLMNQDYTEMVNYMGDISKSLSYSAVNPEELWNKLAEYSDAEEQYRTFIYYYYTQVPATGLEKLKSDMAGKYEEMVNRFGTQKALNALASYIRTYIQKDTAYSLSPGTLPGNKDFVEYFLYEKKKGFCTHYASAATLAFRLAGIPARYVEGYVAKPDEIKKSKMSGTYSVLEDDGNKKNYNIREVRISDAGAHSWVEVYKEGWGWVPVEMTPGFQQDSEDSANEELQATPSPTATPSPSSTPTPTVTPRAEQEDTATDTTKNTKEKEIKAVDVASFFALIVIFLMVLILVAGVLLKLYRGIQYRKADKGKKIIILYHRTKHLIKALGIQLTEEEYRKTAWQLESKLRNRKKEEFTGFVELALKARFGYAPMTEEELSAAEEFYRNIKSQIYGHIPRLKRLYFELFLL